MSTATPSKSPSLKPGVTTSSEKGQVKDTGQPEWGQVSRKVTLFYNPWKGRTVNSLSQTDPRSPFVRGDGKDLSAHTPILVIQPPKSGASRSVAARNDDVEVDGPSHFQDQHLEG